MDDFLAAALAPKPKPRAKRNAATTFGGQSSDSKGPGSSSARAEKRPRRGNENPEREMRADTDRTKSETSAVKASSATAMQVSAPQNTHLPSFLEAVASQWSLNGSKSTRALLEKAKQQLGRKLFDNAHALLTRALVMCTCHAEVRNHIRDVGASLSAIDSIGRCSCRDFVAIAQTRRPQTKLQIGTVTQYSDIPEGDITFPVSELDLEAVYSLSTGGRACTCGSGRIRCSDPDHLAALDQLIAVTSKLGRIDEAIYLGQCYVDLAPHHAQGYLHLAKAILAQAAPKPKDKQLGKDAGSTKSARFAARCLYAHGLHNVTKYGNASDDLVQVLKRCCQRYSQDDYLPSLPLETVEAIFKHLSTSDLLACQRVSKRWQLVLRRVRLRPPQIRFVGSQEPPIKKLQILLRRMPGLQTNHLSIHYSNCSDAKKMAQFVTGLLRHFESLETLELELWADQRLLHQNWNSTVTTDSTKSDKATARVSLGPLPLPPLPAVSKCRRLVLHNPILHRDTPALCFVAWASQTLETIELNGSIFTEPFDFRLPRLQHVKLSKIPWASRSTALTFPLRTFEAATRLEQLHLDNVCFELTDHCEEEFVALLEKSLQNLHTLVIGERCHFRRRPDENSVHRSTYAPFPRLPLGMRCIDILTDETDLAGSILFGGGYNPSRSALIVEGLQPLANLELFRCLSPINFPGHIFQLIDSSLNGAKGRLAHLELNAQNIPSRFLYNEDPNMRIDYPERLRTIGLYNFDWTPTGGMGGSSKMNPLRDRVFLDWVDRFRNAETICMYPAWRLGSWTGGDCGEGGRLVVALVEQVLRQAEEDARTEEAGSIKPDGDSRAKHVKLRKIYQNLMNGTMRERAMTLIGDCPIQIPLNCGDFRPPIFPWPDREELAKQRE
ncbi:hypothetical protein SEPCBS57363_004814 [Sporothrix epigloea]|uniref:F-box domain-containing protein n=1 Tax=Sporothrix epigloea TaxID=1892477 RepID=A0ABP0DWZ9_9PEZI